MGRKLVIFDFCDTLVNFQSANEFCKFVLEKEDRNFYLLLDKIFNQFYLYRVFKKLNIIRLDQKLFLLSGLKGLDKIKIEEYGEMYNQEVINYKLNDIVFQRFLNHINDGHVVVINSGGFEPYIQNFAKRQKVKYAFSTELKYVNNKFTGRILGKDCLGEEKVLRMDKSGILAHSYSEVIVYSDSVTDLPIFSLGTHRVAVIKQKIVPNWCVENFEILKTK